MSQEPAPVRRTGTRTDPHGSGRGHAVGNIVCYAALLLLVLGFIWLTTSQQPKADAEACVAPDLSQVAARTHQGRQHDLTARNDARQDLRRASRSAGPSPTPAQRRQIARLTRQAEKAKAQLAAWRGTQATVDEKASTEINLGRDVNSGVHSLNFTADHRIPGPRYLLVQVGPFANQGGGRELGSENIAAWARLDRDRTHGTIQFCLDPTQRLAQGTAGKYLGALTVEQGRVQRLDTPVTLNLSYPYGDRVLLVGLGICLLASFYTFYLRRSSLPNAIGGTKTALEDEQAAADAGRVLWAPFGFVRGWARYYTDIVGVLTLAAGLVAASGAFLAQYVASDSWEASISTWLTFAGAVGTAFITGATAGKLAEISFWPTAPEAQGNEQVVR